MKPIIFSTPMVQAILDGRKSMTRRVIKDKDITNNFDIDVDGSVYAYINPETGDSYPPTAIAKYQIGDILWVRETWSRIDDLPYDNYVYRTNYGTTEDDSFPPSMFKWKPSIHMPREAARIFLKVTNVSVERLREISRKDCFLEGITGKPLFDCGEQNRFNDITDEYIPTEFIVLWNSTIKKQDIDKYGWDANPWVWVIEFERINKE